VWNAESTAAHHSSVLPGSNPRLALLPPSYLLALLAYGLGLRSPLSTFQPQAAEQYSLSLICIRPRHELILSCALKFGFSLLTSSHLLLPPSFPHTFYGHLRFFRCGRILFLPSFLYDTTVSVRIAPELLKDDQPHDPPWNDGVRLSHRNNGSWIFSFT